MSGICDFVLVFGVALLILYFITAIAVVVIDSILVQETLRNFWRKNAKIIIIFLMIPSLMYACSKVTLVDERTKYVFLNTNSTSYRYVQATRVKSDKTYTLRAKVHVVNGTIYVESIYFSKNNGSIYFNIPSAVDKNMKCYQTDNKGDAWSIKIIDNN